MNIFFGHRFCGNLFFGQRPVFCICLQALLLGAARLVIGELHEHGKMVRSEGGQPLDERQREVLAVKQVIERSAREPDPGMEGIEHTAADAGVEQATDFAEKPRCGRPRNIVKVACHDYRRVQAFHAFRYY